MNPERFRKTLTDILNQADIRVAGNRPWDIKVHDPRFFRRVLAQGTLGAGEAYMDGWWDAQSLDQTIFRFLRAGQERTLGSPTAAFDHLRARLFNRQNQRRAFDVGRQHYDLGNDLFAAMLDSRMIYSCGYWPNAETLEQAQENKLDLVCRKLQLSPGQKVLDIGCGWGGTARYLAERHGVEVTGITISKRQAELARENCAGLPVEILLQDYRKVQGEFDRIVSIGMFEHVGLKNYRTYFETVARGLKEGGLFLLHTIACDTSSHRTDPWIERYIFPNGMLPSPHQITRAWEGLLALEDWHNFGPDYDRTLMAWHTRFNASWPGLQQNYDERFKRMWDYYLLSCAGAFRARSNQLWQIVLSKNGLLGGYQAPR